MAAKVWCSFENQLFVPSTEISDFIALVSGFDAQVG
jgi:hypothetical protein